MYECMYVCMYVCNEGQDELVAILRTKLDQGYKSAMTPLHSMHASPIVQLTLSLERRRCSNNLKTI